MENSRIHQIVAGYQKATDVFYNLIMLLCKVLFIGMVFSVSCAVFGRFVLRSTPRWSEEIGILCMVWICFLSAAMAIRDSTHIRMTIMEFVIPKKACKVLHCLSYVLLLFLSVVWVVYGAEVISMTLIPKMPSTQLPMAVLYSPVAVSGFIGFFMALSRILKGDW